MIDSKKIIFIHRRYFHQRPPVISVVQYLTQLGCHLHVITAGINQHYQNVFKEKGITYSVIPFQITSHVISNAIKGFLWGCKARREINKLAKGKNLVLWIEGNYTFDSLSSNFINKYPHILQNQELFHNPMSLKGKYTMHTLSKIMPTALVNIAPEYNRACIYKSIFHLNELPTILPNKPSFILSDKELELLATKYKKYREMIGGRKVILYQGILSAERNLENFVRATSELDNAKYVTLLLGRKTPFVDKYKTINSNLIHINYIPAPDYLFFTSIAYIGIVTYKSDSLNTMYCAPNKLFEYGAYGIPMLGNNIAGLKYTIEYYGCGLLCNDNSVIDIKNAINKIIENYTSYSEKSKEYYHSTNNREIVKEVIQMAEKKLNLKSSVKLG